ncbi:TetR/AcrR family transcriptional regulator [Streptomyces sp. NPDC057616]|uniref:TetR/AcrR family transcriptional regulator n=1 Tax=Streptomyces sp. NPDC057616 TaxID=3346183 RepID=UPI0036B24CA8
MRTGERSDARDNRRRILAAARHAFASAGPQVSVREIARRAAVSVATVYRHFPSKESLVAEAFAEQLTTCREIVAEGMAQPDPWDGFCLVVEKLMVLHARDQGFARAFALQVFRPSELAEERDRTLHDLAALMRNAKEAGSLRRDVTLADVNMVLMANEGITSPSTAAKVAAARRFAALITQSFRAGPDNAPLPPTPRLAFPALG